jgi:alginate O-acetyltransferase complex protein AlgI
LALLTFYIGYYINLKKDGQSNYKKKIIATSIICLVLLILSFFKYRILQEATYEKLLHQKFEPSDFIFIIGISYISFKMIHFIIEGYRQQLSNITLLNYMNYIFLFPSFISGPINRFNHFSDQLSGNFHLHILKDLKNGFERIIHGFFKKFVICTLIYPYAFLGIKKSLTNFSWPEIFLGLYSTALYFYFDFSAYSDIAIGSSRIMGIELPENFNTPFLKKNLQQLWANWHISLTSWLTDYIYWPLSKKLRNLLYLKKNPILLSNISIIITFIICGIWHGESLNFLIWGLYHGVGLAFLKTYQTQKRKIKNKFLRKYFVSKYSQLVGIVITFHYFVLGMIFFNFDMKEIIKIICSSINLIFPFNI